MTISLLKREDALVLLGTTKRNLVRHIKSELENVLEPSSYPEITTEEVESAAKLSHCNKAGGDDGLCYEHIKYGGHMLFYVLEKL